MFNRLRCMVEISSGQLPDLQCLAMHVHTNWLSLSHAWQCMRMKPYATLMQCLVHALRPVLTVYSRIPSGLLACFVESKHADGRPVSHERSPVRKVI